MTDARQQAYVQATLLRRLAFHLDSCGECGKSLAMRGLTKPCETGAKLAGEWLRFREQVGDVQARDLIREIEKHDIKLPDNNRG